VPPNRLRATLRAAQDALGLPRLTWYQSTRHTFASHWVTDGRPIEKLRDILGHSTVQVTERYAHLAPDAFGRADYAAVSVDLGSSEPDGVFEGGHNRGTMTPGGPKSRPQVAESTIGEVAEWPKAPDSKSGLGASPTWVRLPPSPRSNRINTLYARTKASACSPERRRAPARPSERGGFGSSSGGSRVTWRGVRVAEGARLEIVCTERYRGFESLSLLQIRRAAPRASRAPGRRGRRPSRAASARRPCPRDR
jgi:hypothetical protein